MISKNVEKTVLVTGSAGFIGFHTCLKFLKAGHEVVGIDCLSNYYDVSLKLDREKILLKNKNYISIHNNIEDDGVLLEIFRIYNPSIVIHLAAQAGVRYSIENPRSYLSSNVIGTFELLEAARKFTPKHLLIASTSSAYGANKNLPYREIDKADFQMSFYAATKKSTESMAHSYAHLFSIPITMFRFFTVYGPWGRPDMALFKFTKAILADDPIDVYNYGDMKRDFTYIDDLVDGIKYLADAVPHMDQGVQSDNSDFESKSPVAPFRVVNIGNSKLERLGDYIIALEKAIGKKAKKNLMPMQPGDVHATWADTTLLKELTGFRPSTNIDVGVNNFFQWYQNYYGKNEPNG